MVLLKQQEENTAEKKDLILNFQPWFHSWDYSDPRLHAGWEYAKLQRPARFWTILLYQVQWCDFTSNNFSQLSLAAKIKEMSEVLMHCNELNIISIMCFLASFRDDWQTLKTK